MTTDGLAEAVQRRADMIAAAERARADMIAAADRVLADAVTAAYAAGATTAEVSAATGMGAKGSLARLMRRAGASRPTGRPRRPAEKS